MSFLKKVSNVLSFSLIISPSIAMSSSLSNDKYLDIYSEEYLHEDITINDPLEKINRNIYNFNKKVDKHLLSPVTNLYNSTMPKNVRIAVNSSLSTLKEPVYLINNVIQFEVKDAVNNFWRFFFNMTFGVLGTTDFAGKYLNLIEKPNSFDQSFAKYCIPSGPYFVTPILGPSTIRGGFTKTVDIVADPTNFVSKSNIWLVSKFSLSLINFRSVNGPLIDDIKNLSADEYVMIRSVYTQKLNILEKKFSYCK